MRSPGFGTAASSSAAFRIAVRDAYQARANAARDGNSSRSTASRRSSNAVLRTGNDGWTPRVGIPARRRSANVEGFLTLNARTETVVFADGTDESKYGIRAYSAVVAVPATQTPLSVKPVVMTAPTASDALLVNPAQGGSAAPRTMT